MKKLIWFLLVGAFGAGAGAQDLKLGPGDVRVEARADGYHLFVRAKPGIASILVVESFEPQDHRLSTYAWRFIGANPVNGNEQRLLNGQFLKQPHRSLITSTTVKDPDFGTAFPLLITPQVEFGSPDFPNSRYQRLDLTNLAAEEGKNFWFSLRTFAKPYADYTGAYLDNAFELRTIMTQPPPHETTSEVKYEPKLEEKFHRISPHVTKSSGGEDMLKTLGDILDKVPGDEMDLILCVDTTKSMENNLALLKKELMAPVSREVSRFKKWRIGLVFFRDYMEEYVTRVIGFQTSLADIQKDLNRQTAVGGGDIPEAVWEGVYAGLAQFPWESKARVLILLGDAPPHDIPRGDVTEAMVNQTAQAKGVEVHAIMLPD